MPFQNLFLGRAKLSFEPSIISCLRNRSNGMIFQAEYSEELARVTPAQTLHPIESRPSQRKTRPPYLSLFFSLDPENPEEREMMGINKKLTGNRRSVSSPASKTSKSQPFRLTDDKAFLGLLVGFPHSSSFMLKSRRSSMQQTCKSRDSIF